MENEKMNKAQEVLNMMVIPLFENLNQLFWELPWYWIGLIFVAIIVAINKFRDHKNTIIKFIVNFVIIIVMVYIILVFYKPLEEIIFLAVGILPKNLQQLYYNNTIPIYTIVLGILYFINAIIWWGIFIKNKSNYRSQDDAYIQQAPPIIMLVLMVLILPHVVKILLNYILTSTEIQLLVATVIIGRMQFYCNNTNALRTQRRILIEQVEACSSTNIDNKILILNIKEYFINRDNGKLCAIGNDVIDTSNLKKILETDSPNKMDILKEMNIIYNKLFV